ncbi:hypothetical protein [Saccharopolyspora halophila]|uniref:hypothetical protein n=1 Tax=Saccharopolyspora halophila TaxID=405551 RepID=UPI0031D59E5F
MTTSPEPWSADGPKLNVDEPAARSGARLNQPWRAAVAGLELVVAIALTLFAFWAWQRGVITVHLPGPDGAREVVTRSLGSWLTGAVGAVTLAGLLLIDAIRQLVLAVKTRGSDAGT